jgi:antitoxin YefM
MSLYLVTLVSLTVQLKKENNMRIVSFTEARNGLKSVLDRVVNDAYYTVITRRDSEDAVVMSMDHYNSLMETVHLLKSPANAVHLARSIEQFKSAQIIEREILND